MQEVLLGLGGTYVDIVGALHRACSLAIRILPQHLKEYRVEEPSPYGI